MKKILFTFTLLILLNGYSARPSAKEEKETKKDQPEFFSSHSLNNFYSEDDNDGNNNDDISPETKLILLQLDLMSKGHTIRSLDFKSGQIITKKEKTYFLYNQNSKILKKDDKYIFFPSEKSYFKIEKYGTYISPDWKIIRRKKNKSHIQELYHNGNLLKTTHGDDKAFWAGEKDHYYIQEMKKDLKHTLFDINNNEVLTFHGRLNYKNSCYIINLENGLHFSINLNNLAESRKIYTETVHEISKNFYEYQFIIEDIKKFLKEWDSVLDQAEKYEKEHSMDIQEKERNFNNFLEELENDGK